jgi:hypothetical protein
MSQQLQFYPQFFTEPAHFLVVGLQFVDYGRAVGQMITEEGKHTMLFRIKMRQQFRLEEV